MTTIQFALREPQTAGRRFLFACPPDTPEQAVCAVTVEGCPVPVIVVDALNSGQTALLVPVGPDGGARVTVTFDAPGPGFPDWLHRPTGGRHERPSAELAALIAGIAPVDLAPADRVTAIVRHVEARFTYGVRDVGLADDADAMPALACDTHLGTCVDTHSYAVAAMRAAGFPAAYVSGVFFDGDATEAAPGHCWFDVVAEGAPHHWDISHFLKFNLGPVTPAFNPKPGRRFALAVGRDLVFALDDREIHVPRLSGFVATDGEGVGLPVPTVARIVGG